MIWPDMAHMAMRIRGVVPGSHAQQTTVTEERADGFLDFPMAPHKMGYLAILKLKQNQNWESQTQRLIKTGLNKWIVPVPV